MKQLILSVHFLCMGLALIAHDKREALEFVENKAQWNENVLFRAGLPNGASVYLEETGFKFSFLDAVEFAKLHDLQFATPEEQAAFSVPGHAWRMNFLNTTESVVNGEKKKSYYHNYFTSPNQENWSNRVGVYEMVNYTSFYDGIDLKVYAKDQNFKHDFIVHPNSDPSLIQFDYSGLDHYYIQDGKLVLMTSLGEFRESEPFAYQLINGHLTEVECNYILTDGVVSYEFPSGYNTAIKLVIDPELIASTLSGTNGGSSNYGHSAAFDIEGNIYTGCVAGGTQYPVTTGAFQQTYGGGGWDIGVSKLTPDGSDLIWATYIGGSSSDYPHSLIANNDQELYVYGSTASSDYPTTSNAVQPNSGGGVDIIVSHLNADGTDLIGSTYLGGAMTDGQNANSANYGDNYRGEIIVDYDNNPIITSGSQSTDFPVMPNAYQGTNAGGQDAVLVKLTPNLSTLLVSTYFGGDGSDMGYGLRTFINGDIVIGGSAGDNLPMTGNAYQSEYIGETDGGGWGGDILLDGFLAKFNSSGSSLLASTYHATESKDQVFFLDLDFDENIWAYGQGGGDIEVTEDVYINENSGQFITKFSNDLSELLVGTTIGSGSAGTDFVPDAFLVDNCDNIYISAYNSFGALDITDDALFEDGGFYLAVFEENLGDMIFGTHYTGNHVDGGTSRFDKNGMVYQAVCSGGGFNTTANAWATDQATGWDIGIFKINFDASGVNAAVAGNNIAGCAPFEISFQNFSVGDQFEWDFGDGTSSDEYEPTVTYEDPGVYEVSMIASDSLSCNLADTVSFDIIISTPQDFVPSFDFSFDCIDQVIETNNTTNLDFLTYSWDMGDGTIIEAENAVHEYEEPGDYTVSLLATDYGCDDDEEVSVDVTLLPSVEAEIQSDGFEACEEIEINFEDLSSNSTEISWAFGDNTFSDEANPSHIFIGPNQFEVVLTATNPTSCNITDTDTLLVTVSANQVIESIFELQQTDCEAYTVETLNQSIGEFLKFDWNMGDGTIILDSENVAHDYDAIGNYNVTLTVTDELCDITDDSTLPIEITNEVQAQLSTPDLEGCAPFETNFNSTSVGADMVVWDFGDDSPTVNTENTTHTFATPGTYTVTLSVEGNTGCTGIDDTTAEITVIEPPVLEPDFDMVQSGECLDLNINLTDLSEGPIDNYLWEFGDGNQSVAQDTEHTYSNTGNYTITLTVSEDLCGVTETATLPVNIDDYEDFDLGPNATLCYYSSAVNLSAGFENQGALYSWSTNEESETIAVSEPGMYSVQVAVNGCTFGDAIEVIVAPKLDLDNGVNVCDGVNLIEIPYLGGTNYSWSTGDNSRYTIAPESGNYAFSFTDENGCIQDGILAVELQGNEPTVFIPNAFTPNNDGLNDIFQPVNGNLDEFEFTIYNRWGQEIFYTEDTEDFWQGEYQQGSENGAYYVPNGVYTYEIRYSSNCNTESEEVVGQISVVR
ncbi:MAG: PKD domain-containing protein [Flavobacteriales bacterium]